MLYYVTSGWQWKDELVVVLRERVQYFFETGTLFYNHLFQKLYGYIRWADPSNRATASRTVATNDQLSRTTMVGYPDNGTIWMNNAGYFTVILQLLS